VVAEGEQRGDHAGAAGRDVVAAGAAGLVDQLLAAELAQVIASLPGGVAVLAGDLADPGGVLGDGEPAGGWGEGERCGQRRPDARLVQVDPGDPAGSGLGWQGQLVKDAVGQEPGVGAVQGSGEPVCDAGQPGDDLVEVVQAAAAAPPMPGRPRRRPQRETSPGPQ